MSLLNWMLLILLSMSWGSSFFFIEVALQDFSPFTLVFLRVLFGALILHFILYLQGKRLPSDPQSWIVFMVMGLLNNVFPFCLIVWGQTHITGSEASILNATAPIFTIIVAHFLIRDEHLTVCKTIGVLTGYGGVYVMLVPTLVDGVSVQSYGQLMILMGAFFYACAGVWGKKFLHDSPLINGSGMLTCASIAMLPLVVIFEEPLRLSPDLSGWGSLVALGLISTSFSYLIYFHLLTSAGVTNLLLVAFLNPVSALLLGIGILGEYVHPMSFYGMAFIFSGLMLVDGRILRILSVKRK